MAVKMDREKGKESDSLFVESWCDDHDCADDTCRWSKLTETSRQWRPSTASIPTRSRTAPRSKRWSTVVGMLENAVQNRHFCLDLCSIYIRCSVQQCAGYLTTVFLSWIWAWKYRPDVFTGWMSALCYPSYYVGQLISLRSNGHFSRWMWGSGLY